MAHVGAGPGSVTSWACCSLVLQGVLSPPLGFCLPICTVGLCCPELTHGEGFAHHKQLVSRWYVLLVVGSFVVLVMALAVG